MGKIYADNVDSNRKSLLLQTFLRKYGDFFPQQTMDIQELSWQDLSAAIQAMPDNTPGTDGVRKSDLQILSPNCLYLLTKLLQTIEGGAPWPIPTNTARSAFLSKGEYDLCPQGFRSLAILSKIYRMRAGIRLRHLK